MPQTILVLMPVPEGTTRVCVSLLVFLNLSNLIAILSVVLERTFERELQV